MSMAGQKTDEVEVAVSRLDSQSLADLRADFPALDQQVNGHPLAYLDNAATTHKPRQVIEAVANYYERDNSNVHRGVHELSQRATVAFEAAREKVRAFINAANKDEIVFTRGTTEAINLVANAWGGANLGEGDEILITELEHHSNIVPWQMLAQRSGAVVKVAPINDAGELELEALADLLSPRTRMVALNYVSNTLGSINPVAEVVRLAHDAGALVLVDAAQATPHLAVDVQELDCDFLAFSGHKVYGPTGIGALFGRAELLEAMPPWQGGGDMIEQVSFSGSTYAHPPARFEAGTPNVAGVVGLGAAIDYLESAGIERVATHEHELLDYAEGRLREIPGLRIVGTAAEKTGAHSFVVEGVHPHDIGTVLDSYGVAIRAGHHCTQPLMERLGLVATARASFALYSNHDDVDRLIDALLKLTELFGDG